MRGVENRAGVITQLDFDSLAQEPVSDVSALPSETQVSLPGNRTEIYRPAPRSRSKAKKQSSLPTDVTQATFEDLFAQPAEEEGIAALRTPTASCPDTPITGSL